MNVEFLLIVKKMCAAAASSPSSKITPAEDRHIKSITVCMSIQPGSS